MKCKILSFSEIYEMMRHLSEKIKSSDYSPTTIIGLARGGWIPARLLCDFLGITDLISLKVEHWLETGKTKNEATIKYPITSDMNEKNILIVDDITDTGKSLIAASQYIKTLNPRKIKTAVMQYILKSECKPDYFSEKVTDWYWFIYPWNWIEDTSTLIVRLLSDYEDKKYNLKEINIGLKNLFGISWNTNELKYILNLMSERNQLELIKSSGKIKYKFKTKKVIKL